MRILLVCTCLAVCASAAPLAEGGGLLGLPTDIDGYPPNVGLLILGHSTSAQGDYPAKLASALNDPANSADGRHYFVLRTITGGDGGFLWSRVSVPAADVQYDRVQASQASTQWCQDAGGVRWSCRRAKLEKILTGVSLLPPSGTCAPSSVQSACSPGNAPSATLACTWYDRSRPLSQNPVTQVLSYHDCWMKMDYHLALVQDTSNRSWPIDDYSGNGVVDSGDYWPATRIVAAARPCGGTSGVVGGWIDWNCDGAITAADAAHRNYAAWMERLARDLIDTNRYGAAAAEHVFISHKPVEMGQCTLWPASEQPTCNANRHAVRTPAQIAATPGRPHDHYYVPTVYWEYRALDTLFANPALDPRIDRATPAARAMWDRSVKCYDVGLGSADWTIPSGVPGRPTAVTADDAESDAGGGNSSSVGCMLSDHIHHNDAGGWTMADVWYAGLLPYLR